MKRVALALFLAPQIAAAQPVCPLEALQALQPGIENWYVPSGAMKPTQEPLDCFVSVARESYVPGDVIVFTEGPRNAAFVFRLIATAGQTVQMIGGVPHIDEVPLARELIDPYAQVYQLENGLMPQCPAIVGIGQTCLIQQYQETLNGRSYNTLDLGPRPLDNTGVYTVPPDHVFVLGDNRDNATDSRVKQVAGGRGFVPVDRIIGAVAGK